MKREHAYKLRELMHKAAVSLGDEDALEAVELFPFWQSGEAYELNGRVRYGGKLSPTLDYKLYKCVQAHTSQADWTPDATPALWTEVAKPGEIPVWKQPTGAQDAYNKGDRVWYPEKNTTVYESLTDGNVWEPGTPGLWMEV